jgi:NOL1/NOP2/fmu family ribosome biogenesis protein
MQTLNALNSKEKKVLFKLINSQWGCDFSSDEIFYRSRKDKVYLLSDFDSELVNTVKIDRLGVYFGTFMNAGFRLSIEGSQIIGPVAKKNVLELDDIQFSNWFAGEDLDIEGNNGIHIIKNKNDFFGCGIIKNGNLNNYITKSRRIRVSKQL